MPAVKTVIGEPMERERVDVNPEDIEIWFNELEQAIADVPREFIFNVDETGCSEYADRREMKVIVPAEHIGETVKVPFDRHSKRATLTACIAADGFRMKPFVSLTAVGYTPSNVAVVSQEHAFMTNQLFEKRDAEVFFPALQELRAKHNWDGTALLLMDGLGCHHTERFVQEVQGPLSFQRFLFREKVGEDIGWTSVESVDGTGNTRIEVNPSNEHSYCVVGLEKVQMRIML
jgi:hypothetical protein